MNKKLKDAIKNAYNAPQTLKKEKFLRDIRHCEISDIDFIILQAGFVRKWVWVISGIVLICAAAGAYTSEGDMIFYLAATLPFIALSAVSESIRSERYKMTELEMSSRFSLKSIMLARMGSIGIVHLFVILLIIPFCGKASSTTLLQAAVCLLVPYLATVVISLNLVRRIREPDGGYICLAVAVLVSAVQFVVRKMFYANREDFLRVLLMVLFVLIFAAGREFKYMLRRTEELNVF